MKNSTELTWEEYNFLAGSIKQNRAKTERDLSKVSKQIDQLINAIMKGMLQPSMNDKLTELEVRKSDLEAELRLAPTEEPVMLHPSLALKYRKEVANLQEALDDPNTKAEATSIIRSLLTEIRFVPNGEEVIIELQGELAGLLALGESKNAKSHLSVASSTVMVAGVGFEPTTFRL